MRSPRKKLKKAKKRHEMMLTVEVLIKWLQTQDPKACILAFEPNSNAYIEQFRDIPNHTVSTVKEAKEREREFARGWYRGTDPKKLGCATIDEVVENKVREVFRYAEDNDVIFNF